MKAKEIPLNSRRIWEQRFMENVSVSINGCWLWSGTIDSYGYGVFVTEKKNTFKAHRLSFALKRGYCSSELTIDHLCKNKKCVNPDHMELITNSENVTRGNGPFMINKRKTHCINGHPLSGDNLVTFESERKLGKRQCKICHANRSRISARKYTKSSKYLNKQK